MRKFDFGWRELLLAIAVLALLFQLFPATLTVILWALDFRNWPRTFWFAASWVVLLALVAVRFGPELYIDWRKRQQQREANRQVWQKQQKLKEQREMLARMKEASKRRIY